MQRDPRSAGADRSNPVDESEPTPSGEHEAMVLPGSAARSDFEVVPPEYERLLAGCEEIINPFFQFDGRARIYFANRRGRELLGVANDPLGVDLQAALASKLQMPAFLALLNEHGHIDRAKSQREGLIGYIKKSEHEYAFMQLVGTVVPHPTLAPTQAERGLGLRDDALGLFQCQLLAMEPVDALRTGLRSIREEGRIEDLPSLLTELAVEEDPVDTGPHLRRVRAKTRVLGELAVSSGLWPGVTQADIEEIALWSVTHDIGKISIRKDVLHKREPFTPDDWVHMATHVSLGVDIAMGSGLPEVALELIRHHHTWWDGSVHLGIDAEGRRHPGGYPYAFISGDAIPVPGQLVGIVDWLDAVGTERTYKPAWPPAKIAGVLRELSGRQFDPRLVQLAIENLTKICGLGQT